MFILLRTINKGQIPTELTGDVLDSPGDTKGVTGCGNKYHQAAVYAWPGSQEWGLKGAQKVKLVH